MSKYATTSDVAAGYRALSSDEEAVCTQLITEAETIVDALAPDAEAENKKLVVCRMVRRALGSMGGSSPLGATQGSQTAGPYSQSWTITNGSTGQLYLERLDKRLLGIGSRIGTHSPVEDLCGGPHL